jgi:hypothetical protein
MEYLNEKQPYTHNNAIACYYSYDETCILHGSVNAKKELVILDEFNFEKKSITFIADYLAEFKIKCWINKNDYLANLLKSCYYLDFQDEQDVEQLSDLFKSLLENNRIVFECEKQIKSSREKTMPILVKALNYMLFSNEKPRTYMLLAGGKLKDPTKYYG